MRYDIRLTMSTKFTAIMIFRIFVELDVMHRQVKSVVEMVMTTVNVKPTPILGNHLIKGEVKRTCSYCVVLKSL